MPIPPECGSESAPKGVHRLNTRFLEEFLVFSELLNWTVAAKQLYTTRPTLVEHMRSLESELGCKLVENIQGRPALTAAGRRFTRTAKETLENWDKVCKEYSDLADNLMTIHISPPSLPWIKPALYKARRAIQQRDPEKRIEISSLTGVPDTIDSLRHGDCDIIVANRKSYLSNDDLPIPDDLNGFELDTVDIHLLMTHENPLIDCENIRVANLDGATIVLPPNIYLTWKRDGMAQRFLDHGAHVMLRTMDFNGYDEYFDFEFASMLGIIPATLEPVYGIDQLEEFRIFALEDFPIQSTFFALFRADFAAQGNGKLLFDEMRKAACEQA